MVNFGKFENYFGTFGFEFLCPGSFYKILKNTFDFFFIAHPSLKLRICNVLLKSDLKKGNNK